MSLKLFILTFSLLLNRSLQLNETNGNKHQKSFLNNNKIE